MYLKKHQKKTANIASLQLTTLASVKIWGNSRGADRVNRNAKVIQSFLNANTNKEFLTFFLKFEIK
jgi:hypothetical protein